MLKVIGSTDSGFIVEMSREDLAQIFGYAYFSSANRENPNFHKEGFKFPINDIYQRAADTLNEYKTIKKNMDAVRGSITKLLKFMEPKQFDENTES
jgi:hypothetical protein